jgi:GTP-binding protein HflX
MEHLFRRRMLGDEVFSLELAKQICALSREVGRQIGALVDRNGRVQEVVVGDAHKVELASLRKQMTSGSRLIGLRLVHTHLKDEEITREDLLLLVMHRLDLVAAISAGENGSAQGVRLAMLMPPGGKSQYQFHNFPSPERTEFDFAWELENLEAELARKAARAKKVEGVERALLIGLSVKNEDTESLIDEMKELARTAGVEIAEVIWQRRREPDPKYLIGKGKLEEITVSAMQHGVDFLLFASDLSPAQSRSIEDLTSFKVIDRTQLILDIFARRARSRDGKLQVELAQLKYMLPRLSEQDTGLSRHTGGIGLRGPGETKLEISRRRAREKIARLETGIRELGHQREIRRSKRREAGIPVISIVGYTNAGKSTLLNKLTNSNVLVENKLFATLDTSSRRLRFPEERDAIVTDTVGFIRELPPDLKNAFRATLEELDDADLLLHVVDAAAQGFEARIDAVDRLLSELGLDAVPQILVFNKTDLLDPREAASLSRQHRSVPISAESGEGLAELLAACDGALFSGRRKALREGH